MDKPIINAHDSRQFDIKSKDGLSLGSITLEAWTPSGVAAIDFNIYGRTTHLADLKAVADLLSTLRADLADMRDEELPENSTAIEVRPAHDRDLFGVVAVNSVGKPGVVTGFEKLPWGWSYVGYNVNDGSDWCAREPITIARNLGVYIARVQRIAYDVGARGETLKAAA